MDEAARQVFSKNKQYIKQNLYLESGILDYLEAQSVLTPDCVESIQVEKTNSDKISMLLLTLQRKGNQGFQTFLEALTEEKNDFLANQLRGRYECEISKNLNESNTDDKIQENSSQDEVPDVTLYTGHQHVGNLGNSNTSRRSSYSIPNQNCLDKMYDKLKLHLFRINDRELSCHETPKFVTIEMVDHLLDRLLKIEKDCYEILNLVPGKSLVSHVIDLEASKELLHKQIENKVLQIRKYSQQIHDLKKKCRELEKTSVDSSKAYMKEKAELQETVEKMKEELATKDDAVESRMRYLTEENNELRSRLAEYEIQFTKMSENIAQQEEKNAASKNDTQPRNKQHMYFEDHRNQEDISKKKSPRMSYISNHHQSVVANMHRGLTTPRGYLNHSRTSRRNETIHADRNYNSCEDIHYMTEGTRIAKPIEPLVKETEKYKRQNTLTHGKLKSSAKVQGLTK